MEPTIKIVTTVEVITSTSKFTLERAKQYGDEHTWWVTFPKIGIVISEVAKGISACIENKDSFDPEIERFVLPIKGIERNILVDDEFMKIPPSARERAIIGLIASELQIYPK